MNANSLSSLVIFSECSSIIAFVKVLCDALEARLKERAGVMYGRFRTEIKYLEFKNVAIIVCNYTQQSPFLVPIRKIFNI
jgi:hypothetical protein